MFKLWLLPMYVVITVHLGYLDGVYARKTWKYLAMANEDELAQEFRF
jgi:hypothetical protein